MTNTTLRLIDRLSQLVDQNKYLILSGGIGVGKTYLACAVAENCALPQYNAQGSPPPGRGYEVVSEMVPIHPSYSYENFVAGVAVSTRNGKAVFRCEDKIFLSMLHRAEQSWSRRDGKKYFLILDDIGRGEISEILGDMLSLIEPHGASGRRIPPNMYIIATKNDTAQPVRPLHYGFFRHFYEYPLENDYKYMVQDPAGTYSDFDMSAQALYFRARRIVLENLRGGFSASRRERLRYVIGHGVFKQTAPTLAVKYQVIPMLRQYEKDGILNRTAEAGITALQIGRASCRERVCSIV